MEKKILFFVITAVVATIMGAIFYFFIRANESEKISIPVTENSIQSNQIQDIIAQQKNITFKQSTTSNEIGQSFEKSIGYKTKDYQAVSKLLADYVSFTINSTECCGSLPRDLALINLHYINDAGEFNFSPQYEINKKIKSSGQIGTVGVSQYGTVISYGQNAEGRIDYIYISNIQLELMK